MYIGGFSRSDEMPGVYFTISFSCLAARNFGATFAGIWIFCWVRGLIPSRAARRETLKTPNPATFTCSPFTIFWVFLSKILPPLPGPCFLGPRVGWGAGPGSHFLSGFAMGIRE